MAILNGNFSQVLLVPVGRFEFTTNVQPSCVSSHTWSWSCHHNMRPGQSVSSLTLHDGGNGYTGTSTDRQQKPLTWLHNCLQTWRAFLCLWHSQCTLGPSLLCPCVSANQREVADPGLVSAVLSLEVIHAIPFIQTALALLCNLIPVPPHYMVTLHFGSHSRALARKQQGS